MAQFDFGEAMRAKPEKERPQSRHYLLVLIAVVLITIIISLVFLDYAGKIDFTTLIRKEMPASGGSSEDNPLPFANETGQSPAGTSPGTGPSAQVPEGQTAPPALPEEQLPQENPKEFNPATAPSAQTSEPPPALPEFI
ncbi:MAG: hypothetical protein HY514_04550 [Candidatus Aenigmarchaeota archaeon]|nr:hypothetical protein [Candidatus Aenigmarchaeota archaeon]